MDHFKKQASTFLTRAKQFTEEKLGGAEKTEYDGQFESLLRKADSTRIWTERIVSNSEAVLQPNPNERLEDFVLTKFDKKVPKPNNLEILGHCMYESGNDLGQNTLYGSALIKVGEAEKKLGFVEKEFVQKSADSFIQPLKSFLDGQMKIIQKEKKTLEAKRLDLDACKTKIKKHKDNKTKPEEVAKDEHDLRKAQTEFDRQLELLKLLLDELHVTHSHHLRCLSDFVDAQLIYHNNAVKILQDLQKQIGGLNFNYNIPNIYNNNNNNANAPIKLNNNQNATLTTVQNTKINNSNIDNHNSVTNFNGNYSGYNSNNTISNNINNSNINSSNFTNVANTVNPANNKVKAKVLFDYEAGDETELTVLANEIIQIKIDADETDWVYGQRGNDFGKIPKAYIQIIE